MQVYILMQSAGPFGQAAQNADERRRAVCRAALRVSSVSGGGAAVGVTERGQGSLIEGAGKAVRL